MEFAEPHIGASWVWDAYENRGYLYRHISGHHPDVWRKTRLNDVEFYGEQYQITRDNNTMVFPMIDIWARPEFPSATRVRAMVGLNG